MKVIVGWVLMNAALILMKADYILERVRNENPNEQDGDWVRCFCPDKMYQTLSMFLNVRPQDRGVSTLQLCYPLSVWYTIIKYAKRVLP